MVNYGHISVYRIQDSGDLGLEFRIWGRAIRVYVAPKKGE